MQGKQKKGVILNTKNILILSAILVVISLGALWLAQALSSPFSWGYQTPGTATNYTRGGASYWLNFSVTNNDGQFDTVYLNHPVGNLNDHSQIIFEDSQVPDGTGSCSNDTSRLACTTFTQLNGTTKVFSLKLKMNNTYNGKVNISVEGWSGGTRVSAAPNSNGYFHINFTIDSTAPAVNFNISDSRGLLSDSAANYLGWLVSGSGIICNASDAGSGPNGTGGATNYSLYYGAANNSWTALNVGAINATSYFTYANFNDTGFFVLCNATDNVSNQGTVIKQYLGFDSIKPVLSSASASEGTLTSDYIFNSTYTPVNLSVNVTDFFLLNVTLHCNVSGGTDILLTNVTSETTVSNTTYANTTLVKNTATRNLTSLCNLGANTEVPLNLTFIAYDNASNSQIASLTAYWDDLRPRVTNPTINITTNVTKGLNSTMFTFSVLVVDQNISAVYIANTSGIANKSGERIALTQSGNTWSNATLNLSMFYGWQGNNDGVYTLLVNATDLAGNYNDSVTLTVVVDNSAPNVTGMIASRYVVNNNTNFTIQFSATDHIDNSKVFLVNVTSMGYGDLVGTTYSNIGNATTYCLGFEGICAIRANVTDYAGNNNQSITVNITIDNVAPAINGVTVANTTSLGLMPTGFVYVANSSFALNLTLNASDSGLRSDGNAVVLVNVTNNLTNTYGVLTESWSHGGTIFGSNYTNVTSLGQLCGLTSNTESGCLLTFTAKDNATNTVTSTLTVYYDNQVPRVSGIGINATNISRSINDPINITVTIVDQNLTGVAGGAATVGRAQIINESNAVVGNMKKGSGNTWYYEATIGDFTSNVDGVHTFYVNATDAAGNVNRSVNYTIQLDAATPATTAVSTSPSIIKNTESLKVFANISATSNVTKAWVKFSGTDYEMTLSSTGPFVNANRTLAAATFSTLADGTYTVAVFGQSAGGTNQSAFALANNATFTIDSTAITGTVLQAMIDGVNSTLQSVQSNVSAVSANVQQVNLTLQSVQSNVSAVSANVQQVNLTLQQVQSNVSAVSANVQGLNSTIQAMQTNRTTDLAHIQQVNLTLQQVQSNVSAVSANVQQVNLTLQQVQSNVSAVSGNVQGLNSTVISIQSNVSAVSGNVQQVNLTLQQVQSNVSAVSGNVQGLNSTLSTNISQLFTHYAGLASANATLLGMINGLNSTLQSVQANLTAVSANVQGLNSTVISIQSNVSAVSGNVQGLNSTVISIQSNVSAVSGNVQGLNSTIQAVQVNVSNLNATVALLNTNVTTLFTMFDLFKLFNITITTPIAVVTTENVTLNITTSVAASCTWNNLNNLSQTAALHAYSTTIHDYKLAPSNGVKEGADNIYEVRCVDSTWGFTTTKSVFITRAGVTQILRPEGGGFWYSKSAEFWMSKYSLDQAVTINSTSNYSVQKVFNSINNKYNMVWAYDTTSGSWRTNRVGAATNTLDLVNATLGYYVLNLTTWPVRLEIY